MMFFLENVAYSQLNKQHLVGRCGSARKMICVKAGRGGGSSRNRDGASLPGVDLLCTQLDETTRR